MRIILASQSKARRKALDLLNLQYEVCPSNIDKKAITDANPETRAKRIAEAKASTVSSRYQNALLIAGDLFVVCNGKIYEKPKDKQEALSMLLELSGKRMQIVAGVAALNTQTNKMFSAAESYYPAFRTLTKAELDAYVNRFPSARSQQASHAKASSCLQKKVKAASLSCMGSPCLAWSGFSESRESMYSR